MLSNIIYYVYESQYGIFWNRFLQPNLVQLHQQNPPAKQYTCVVPQGVEHEIFCPCFLKFLGIWQLPHFSPNKTQLFWSNVKLLRTCDGSFTTEALHQAALETSRRQLTQASLWLMQRVFCWGSVVFVPFLVSVCCGFWVVGLFDFLCAVALELMKTSFLSKKCLCRSFWDL